MGGITSMLGFYGAVEQGQAEKQAYYYNAQVAKNNALAAKMNAQLAGEAGAAQAEAKGMQNRSTYGQIKANQGSSGIDVNSGSAVAVRQSAKELGLLDTQTIRSNAAREAYGYQVQSVNFNAQAILDKYEGNQAEEAGWISGFGTLLGGAEQDASQLMQLAMFAG